MPKRIDNIERKNLLEQQRRIKPGECLKYIRVQIDPEFLCGAPGSQILDKLVALGVKFDINPQKHPRTILWERSELQNLMAVKDTLAMTEKHNLEDYVIYFMLGEDFVTAIISQTLHSQIKKLTSLYNKKSLTLLIFGLKKYCKSNPNVISRGALEKSFTELQVFYNCNHRLQENAEDIANSICQYTKAIAEIPFKKQLSEKYAEANCFVLNDNRDCVRIEGAAGLSRLWQQHLTRIPLVTLDTAEAIINEFPNPSTLFDAYKTNSENGNNILADLKIRRAGGPLNSARRIGPELSRKIHTLYTSLNPNEKI